MRDPMLRDLAWMAVVAAAAWRLAVAWADLGEDIRRHREARLERAAVAFIITAEGAR